MNAPFKTSRRVEFRETDMAGIVHFSNFFTWMEQAEHEVWRALGLGVISKIDGHTISWPRVSAECNYRRAIRFEEIIDVEISIARIGTKSLTWVVRFFHSGQPVANGTITTVCCQIVHGQQPVSIDIPQAVREKLSPLVESAE